MKEESGKGRRDTQMKEGGGGEGAGGGVGAGKV